MDNPFNTPWLIDHQRDMAPVVVDADRHFVCMVRPGNDALTALMTLAPEVLNTLADLMEVLRRFDDGYCAHHGLPPASPAEMTGALSDAIALLHHARELGIPLEIRS